MAAAGIFMCILYPCGIPLLFALLMRRERQLKMGKVCGNSFVLYLLGSAAFRRVKIFSIPTSASWPQATA